MIQPHDMDVAIPAGRIHRRKLWRGLAITASLAAVYLICLAAIPRSIPLSSLSLSSIRLETEQLEIPAEGRLAVTDERAIIAAQAGVATQIRVKPGETVKAGAVLVVLVNDQLRQELVRAQLALSEKQAVLVQGRSDVIRQLLTAKAKVATTAANLSSAKLERDAYADLARQGITSRLAMSKAEAAYINAQTEYDSAQSTLQELQRWSERLSSSEEATLRQESSLVHLVQAAYDDLTIRAPTDGTVADIASTVRLGARLTQGQEVGRFYGSRQFEADVTVPASVANLVQTQDAATVDIGDEAIHGTVTRVDPRVENQMVRVLISLPRQLPQSARPDLTIAARIHTRSNTKVKVARLPAGTVDHGHTDIRVRRGQSTDVVMVPIQVLQHTDAGYVIDGDVTPDDAVVTGSTTRLPNDPVIAIDIHR